MVMWRWVRSLSTSFWTASGVTTSSPSPWMMMPEEGQGARKVKSYMLAGGAIEMKPRTSGRRISSCMPIQAPKLKPAIQVVSASGWIDCTQSSAEAASRQLADAVVEHALALADAAEVEAQGREAAPDEGLVERLDDGVVHRAAALRMRVEDQRDRRARAGAGAETAFETALGPGKDDFGHCTCVGMFKGTRGDAARGRPI